MRKMLPFVKSLWSPEMEKKAAPLQYYEEDRTVTFYAAIWDIKDLAGDILHRGCCAKSIQEHGPESESNQKILMLAFHDHARPIGKLLSIEEDETGLLCKAEIAKTRDGDEVIELIKAGVINQFSIGFRYIWANVRYDEDSDTYHVYEIRLFEVSAVSIGASADTGVKGVDEDKLNRETEEFIKSLPEGSGLTARQLFEKWYSLDRDVPPQAHVEDEPEYQEETTVEKLLKVKELLTKNQ